MINTVEVRLYASLRRYYPDLKSGEPLSLTLDDNVNLENLLDKLKVPREEITIVMVNGRREQGSYLFQDGDRIGVFPLIGGG
ncbi:MAG: MoaD/ThiS family protein [Dehalococcoidales bacterium]|jgi:sulfur carrier protein ThiS|nr:thiamine S protein [Dehalococcoidales bacterium]MDP6043439.1 MoaD/ThiS family protein [Dehalococcoidales bacterium]MDP6448952.1 MoaD/ThiS family protein [Dehalococcoidales bacterium]MDP6576994.1 MoaD/ThiS family protein [Dehalococcoidales bacterium]MDP6825295.1 MoaD/ThiS family protein [Dehalococcoidales bacterium]|tara:strand:- start:1209 stop:1454 length:246 start_codon:yes stop_codon:yes gene_type:complete